VHLRHYFAFGSNMCSAELLSHCPHARALGRARLSGYRLAFTAHARFREGGLADIVPIGPRDPRLDYDARGPGASEPYALTPVWGVVWDIPAEELDSLDRKERYLPGQPVEESLYIRVPVKVLLHGAEVNHLIDAFAYSVVDKAGHIPPHERYLDLMLEGASEHGLPPDYIREVTRVAHWKHLHPGEERRGANWIEAKDWD
jgi:gamma-glutamylcyclotransferase